LDRLCTRQTEALPERTAEQAHKYGLTGVLSPRNTRGFSLFTLVNLGTIGFCLMLLVIGSPLWAHGCLMWMTHSGPSGHT
jgi:hypothetical protein